MARLIVNHGNEFEFEGFNGRRFRVPFGRKITPRSPTARKSGSLARVVDDGMGRPKAKWATAPKSWIELESLESDYDLSSFIIEGEPLPPERDERPRETKPPSAIQIAGLPLEVVDDDFVSLRSLFEPFGKRPVEQMARLRTWANLREVRLAARTTAEKRAENLPPVVAWAIHWRHVAQAIAELDPRGMNEQVREGLVRFKRECAEALADYFMVGRAENPRTKSDGTLEKILAALTSGQLETRAEVRERPTRAEVETIVDERIDAKIAEMGRDTAAAAGGDVAAAADRMTAEQMLREAGLPWERGERGPRFAPVLWQAVRRAGHDWKKNEGVPREVFSRCRPYLDAARNEFRRLGWAVDTTGVAVFASAGRRFQIETVVKKLTEAMRVAPAPAGEQQAMFS